MKFYLKARQQIPVELKLSPTLQKMNSNSKQ